MGIASAPLLRPHSLVDLVTLPTNLPPWLLHHQQLLVRACPHADLSLDLEHIASWTPESVTIRKYKCVVPLARPCLAHRASHSDSPQRCVLRGSGRGGGGHQGAALGPVGCLRSQGETLTSQNDPTRRLHPLNPLTQTDFVRGALCSRAARPRDGADTPAVSLRHRVREAHLGRPRVHECQYNRRRRRRLRAAAGSGLSRALWHRALTRRLGTAASLPIPAKGKRSLLSTTALVLLP